MTLPNYESAPWDKYPTESAESFACFVHFRDAGLGRSLAATTRALQGAYSYGWIVATSQAWKWRERARAFDAWKASESGPTLKELRISEKERWIDNRLQMAEAIGGILEIELDRIRKRQADGIPLREATLARLIEIHHKNQQIATGGPTEIVDNRVDLENLKPEDRAALEAARPALEQLAKG